MAHLHPVLRFIYFLLRIFAWLAGHIFYRQRLVLGHSNLKNFHGPALVVTNHPSTLMDVLNVGLPVPKEMFFLANYGLFKNPVSNWILTRLYCIPIKRKEDVSEGDTRNNDSAFEQSFQHLEKEGILFIAPEGYSFMNRWVREFKTGTARIAFGAESRNNWQLGLKVYPVGLTYSAANLFRSQLVVNYGEPLEMQEWATTWKQHHAKAVDALTAELQQRVTQLTIHTRDEAGQELITRLEELLANARPLPPVETFERSQWLANHYLDEEPLQLQVNEYFTALQKAHLHDIGLENTLRPSAGLHTFSNSFFLALASPLFILVYAYWWLPCFLPWLLAKVLKLYVGYDSTLKVIAGAITFPMWLWGTYRLVLYFSGSSAWAWLAIVGLVALGFLVERYQDIFRASWEKQKTVFFAGKHPEAWSELIKKRTDLLALLPVRQMILDTGQ